MRDWIRKEQDRKKLRQLILDGAASGRGAVSDAACFDSLRKRVRQGPEVVSKPKTARARVR